MDIYCQSPNPLISPGFHELKIFYKKQDEILSFQKELECKLRNVVKENKKPNYQKSPVNRDFDIFADKTENISQLKLDMTSIDALEKNSPLKRITPSQKNTRIRAESIQAQINMKEANSRLQQHLSQSSIAQTHSPLNSQMLAGKKKLKLVSIGEDKERTWVHANNEHVD